MIHIIINRTKTFVRKNTNIIVCQYLDVSGAIPHQLNYLIINNIRSGSKCA